MLTKKEVVIWSLIVIAFAVVVYFSPIRTSEDSEDSEDLPVLTIDNKYYIKIGAMRGNHYSGSIGADGNSHTVEGIGKLTPENIRDYDTYEVTGDTPIAVVQLKESFGLLYVEIYDSSGGLVNSGSTKASYGVVTVTGK